MDHCFAAVAGPRVEESWRMGGMARWVHVQIVAAVKEERERPRRAAGRIWAVVEEDMALVVWCWDGIE